MRDYPENCDGDDYYEKGNIIILGDHRDGNGDNSHSSNNEVIKINNL